MGITSGGSVWYKDEKEVPEIIKMHKQQILSKEGKFEKIIFETK